MRIVIITAAMLIRGGFQIPWKWYEFIGICLVLTLACVLDCIDFLDKNKRIK